jgi:hypothetical protein
MAKGTVERSFEKLFDGVFSRIFRSGVKPLQIGRRMLQVVDSERSIDAQGRRVVPNSYVVNLSQEDREGFGDLEPSLQQELTVALREYISQEGYHVEGKARVALRTDRDLRKGSFTIDAKTLTASPADESSSTSVQQQSTSTPADTVRHFTDRPPAVLTLPGGQRIELHQGRYVLGRQLENDIVVNDSNVSRRHAEFVSSEGIVTVRDLGSTNGTKVNGVLVNGEQHLEHGDVINFGTAQVTFEAS